MKLRTLRRCEKAENRSLAVAALLRCSNARLRIFSQLLTLALPILLAGSIPAQLSAPRIGVVRYANRTVRVVYGVPSNFVIADQMLDSADAISFSNSGGLIAKDGKVQIFASGQRTSLGEYATGGSLPVLNIDGDLTTAVAWLPGSNVLLHWNGQSFAATEVASGTITGNVSSLRLSGPETVELLATQSGGEVLKSSVSLQTGNLISSDVLPGVQGPAFLQSDFVVFHDDQGLEIESASGVRHTLSLAAADLAVERMSNDWLHISSPRAKQDWALHLSNTALDLSALPGSAR